MNKPKLLIRIIISLVSYIGYIYFFLNLSNYYVEGDFVDLGVLMGSYSILMFFHALIGGLMSVFGFILLANCSYCYLVDQDIDIDDLVFSVQLLLGPITLAYMVTKSFLIPKED